MLFSELMLDEVQVLTAPMCEMANLFPESTGLAVVIWFGEVGGQHGPRIKVSNVKGRFALADNFVVSVDKDPKVLTPRSMELKSTELADVIDWIKLNYDDLMQMWSMYENGKGDPNKIIAGLKRI